MELLEMLNEYQALLEKKDILAKQTKENNQDIKVMMGDIAQEMIDADVPEMAVGDYVFSLRDKTEYSKKSNADLAEAGLDYFEVLREQGLGDLIVEQVNARTLNTAIKNLVQEEGELRPELEDILNQYETFEVTRRKKRNSSLKKAKGGN